MLDQTKALLEAGDVRRLHTWPHHMPYTVASHSWRMACLLFTLWPDEQPRQQPSPVLVWAVLFHDCAERYVGDVPAPTKWLNASLKAEFERIENSVLMKLGVRFGLDPLEQNWLRALDLAELYLFALDDYALGNSHMLPLIKRCEKRFEEWTWIPDPIRGFLETYEGKRTEIEDVFNGRSD